MAFDFFILSNPFKSREIEQLKNPIFNIPIIPQFSNINN